MKKLRLLVTKKCNMSCKGCCNKDYDLNSLPIHDLKDSSNYDEILITGGEPTLDSVDLVMLSYFLKKLAPNTKIYIYTNGYNTNLLNYLLTKGRCDGITLTLHNKKSIESFFELNSILLLNQELFKDRSFRLNVFKGVKIPESINTSMWKIKDNIVWIKNCPIPEDEEFKQLKNLF